MKKTILSLAGFFLAVLSFAGTEPVPKPFLELKLNGNLENTGYALPGHACLYNVDIMEETSHILAMGAGGISKRIWPEEGHITRAPNVGNIEVYIQRTEEMIERKKELFLKEP